MTSHHIMISHPTAVKIISWAHILSMPYSFPSLAASVRGRGWYYQERWIAIFAETEDMWNLWLVLSRHRELSDWVVLGIGPWWGTWSEKSAPSEEVAITHRLRRGTHAEPEPVECYTNRRVRFAIDCEVLPAYQWPFCKRMYVGVPPVYSREN